MGKHRKNTRYRRMVIAAVAVSAVGIPSAAVACTNWPDAGGHRSTGAQGSAARDPWNQKHWWNDANWGRPWNAQPATEPTRTAPSAPTATKAPSPSPSTTKAPHAPGSAQKSAAPGPKATAHRHPARTTAPKPHTAVRPGPRSITTAAATPKPSSTPKPAATASGAVARVLALVNTERGKVGCPDLTLNTTLSKVAQAHSDDMALHRNMSHSGSDGSSPGDRITTAGYTWSAYGENVAYGYSTPEQVMAGWMASPGHKANILNCAFKEIGIGLAEPDSYWTQDFGTRR
ncbi:CAP domain-containing protein [Streptomyces sp. NPDC001068]|uniref:CAP domain-containing protein n=1 Tax=Streptomyces sp. NPDC001068 TaxID=3364544 RepID=UPI00368A3CD0